jgi:hypothetical protein
MRLKHLMTLKRIIHQLTLAQKIIKAFLLTYSRIQKLCLNRLVNLMSVTVNGICFYEWTGHTQNNGAVSEIIKNVFLILHGQNLY